MTNRPARMGDAGQDIVNLFTAISPWNAIIEGHKASETASVANANVAAAQAQAAQFASGTRLQMTKYIAIGAGVFMAGLTIIAIAKRHS